MVILHIAAIDNNPFNGVCVAVPQHVISQKGFAEVGFININSISINALMEYSNIQLSFRKPFNINALPKPFNKPDVVVFHECYRAPYLQMANNLKRNNIPYVIMPHGELRTEAQKKKHLKKIVANTLLFNAFINQAAAIQCLSRDELLATHFGKRKFIGSNGISMPIYSKKDFSKIGVNFIYIGRYEWKVKGLDLLFKAINIESDYLRSNNCHFDLYGPDILGRLDEVRQLVIRNRIEDLVSLNTEISGEEKVEKLLGADVFVQTSRHEGMPMGILEALSYGIPCLITEGTSLGTQVREAYAGWCAENNCKSIADNLHQVVENRNDWKKMGSNGSRYVQLNYSWPKVAKCNIDHLSRICTGDNG